MMHKYDNYGTWENCFNYWDNSNKNQKIKIENDNLHKSKNKKKKSIKSFISKKVALNDKN